MSFNLAKLMGLELDVKSEVGKGSTFAITVPVYKNQAPRSIDQTFEDQTLAELRKEVEKIKAKERAKKRKRKKK